METFIVIMIIIWALSAIFGKSEKSEIDAEKEFQKSKNEKEAEENLKKQKELEEFKQFQEFKKQQKRADEQKIVEPDFEEFKKFQEQNNISAEIRLNEIIKENQKTQLQPAEDYKQKTIVSDTNNNTQLFLKIALGVFAFLIGIALISFMKNETRKKGNELKRKEASFFNSKIAFVKSKDSLHYLDTLKIVMEEASLKPEKIYQEHMDFFANYDKATTSHHFLKQVLIELTISEFKRLNKNNYDELFFTHKLTNKLFLDRLYEHREKRTQFLEEEKKDKKIKLEAEALVKKKSRTNAVSTKKSKTYKTKRSSRKVERLFSAWDSHHRGLVKYIKNTMHDPSSFEHNKTSYEDKGDHLIVGMSFRGKNAFGAIILKKVIARCDYEGGVEKILYYE